jgi:hypothetical protein
MIKKKEFSFIQSEKNQMIRSGIKAGNQTDPARV